MNKEELAKEIFKSKEYLQTKEEITNRQLLLTIIEQNNKILRTLQMMMKK